VWHHLEPGTRQRVKDIFSQYRSEPLDPDDELPEWLDPDAGLSKTERARERALERQSTQQFLAEHPNHPTIERVVDNRVFLLGLNELYRKRMKRHESTELLACAQAVAAELNVSPAHVPIEGYYAETKRLTEYFRLVHGLRTVEKEHAGRVSDMREFERLRSVLSAPLYGRPVEDRWILPVGRDPLAQALLDTSTEADVSRWTLASLMEQAHRVAVEGQDFSLVGLASVARDAVVLAAVRESVALYDERVYRLSRQAAHPPVPVYVWRVDDELAHRGMRFVATFNELFDDDLPEPVAENGDLFFIAARMADISGRCICIGQTTSPVRYYHWAVHRGADGQPAVEEFWDTTLWTTERYSSTGGPRLPNDDSSE
jgi:hypothetical protein